MNNIQENVYKVVQNWRKKNPYICGEGELTLCKFISEGQGITNVGGSRVRRKGQV